MFTVYKYASKQYRNGSFAMADNFSDVIAREYIGSDDRTYENLINIICKYLRIRPIKYYDFNVLISSINWRIEKLVKNDKRDEQVTDTISILDDIITDETYMREYNGKNVDINMWTAYCTVTSRIFSGKYIEPWFNDNISFEKWCLELSIGVSNTLKKLRKLLLHPGVGIAPRYPTGKELVDVSVETAKMMMPILSDSIETLIAARLINHGVQDFDWFQNYAEVLEQIKNDNEEKYTDYKSYKMLVQDSIRIAKKRGIEVQAYEVAEELFRGLKDHVYWNDLSELMDNAIKIIGAPRRDILYNNDFIGFVGLCLERDLSVPQKVTVDEVISAYKNNTEVHFSFMIKGCAKKLKDLYRDQIIQFIRANWPDEMPVDGSSVENAQSQNTTDKIDESQGG